MKQYQVVSGVLVIGANQRINLSPSQVGPRRHKVKAVPDAEDVYEAVEPLQFIVGEVLGVVDLLPVQEPFVALTDAQKELDAAEAKKSAKAETKAERKKREAEEAEWSRAYAADPDLQASFATAEAYVEDRRKQAALPI